MVGGKWLHMSSSGESSATPHFVDDMWFKYILSVISATIAEGGKQKCDFVSCFQTIRPSLAFWK